MQKLAWKPGRLALAQCDAPVCVSATRFTYKSVTDMPGVFHQGMQLRRDWAGFEGSMGLSMSGDLFRRSTYTVSAWRSEADLRNFVRHPRHLALMLAYRERMESSSTASWQVDVFSLGEAWRMARTRLTGLP